MTRMDRVVLDSIRSVFGWCSVVFLTVLLFFPLVTLFLVTFPLDRDRKSLHVIVSLWAKAILIVSPVMSVHIEGRQHLRSKQAYVLVANHQSLVDILAVLYVAHPFKFVAKKELFWIPFLGWALSVAGYIPLVRTSHSSGKEALQRSIQYLKRGTSVLFFPEGTRSRDGEIHNFKAGAFRIAAQEGLPVAPIVIDGTRDIIKKGSLVVRSRRNVTVQIGRPRFSEGQDDLAIERFLNEVRSDMIERLEKLRMST